MTQERLNYFGSEILKKTYDDDCKVKSEWQRINSHKLKSLYLPYFINVYEIVGTNNELLFDDCLNNVHLYFHPNMVVYMAVYNKKIIYHTPTYMIMNTSPTWNSYEWTRLQ